MDEEISFVFIRARKFAFPETICKVMNSRLSKFDDTVVYTPRNQADVDQYVNVQTYQTFKVIQFL